MTIPSEIIVTEIIISEDFQARPYQLGESVRIGYGSDFSRKLSIIAKYDKELAQILVMEQKKKQLSPECIKRLKHIPFVITKKRAETMLLDDLLYNFNILNMYCPAFKHIKNLCQEGYILPQNHLAKQYEQVNKLYFQKIQKSIMETQNTQTLAEKLHLKKLNANTSQSKSSCASELCSLNFSCVSGASACPRNFSHSSSKKNTHSHAFTHNFADSHLSIKNTTCSDSSSKKSTYFHASDAKHSAYSHASGSSHKSASFQSYSSSKSFDWTEYPCSSPASSLSSSSSPSLASSLDSSRSLNSSVQSFSDNFSNSFAGSSLDSSVSSRLSRNNRGKTKKREYTKIYSEKESALVRVDALIYMSYLVGLNNLLTWEDFFELLLKEDYAQAARSLEEQDWGTLNPKHKEKAQKLIRRIEFGVLEEF